MSRLRALIAFGSFTLAALAVTSAAHAQGECDKYTTSYDKTYCMAKLFVESDKDLNEVYGALTKVIGEPVRLQLRDTQRTWIRYRDHACEAKGTIDVDCNYRVNHERANYLRDRLTECKAGTCRNPMIVSRSWKE
jgi:uncharacterized protein YecT (DUF1311 family)